ncbi:hypothetical protein GCM10012275_28960 [Longimycelium tulufanense]|uniref:Uncharacterized protein n=1 Tax=Longimycelium tulufanense TaxID=907463 RepID=A0A8J3CD16_9PSEU|nr:hypothetical protein GCM10012275_28960 [Longimycelium tulufanense]
MVRQGGHHEPQRSDARAIPETCRPGEGIFLFWLRPDRRDVGRPVPAARPPVLLRRPGARPAGGRTLACRGDSDTGAERAARAGPGVPAERPAAGGPP